MFLCDNLNGSCFIRIPVSDLTVLNFFHQMDLKNSLESDFFLYFYRLKQAEVQMYA